MEGGKLNTKLIIWKDKAEKSVHNIEWGWGGWEGKSERKSKEPRNSKPR